MSDVDHVEEALAEGALERCEYLHGLVYFTPGQRCPACEAVCTTSHEAQQKHDAMAVSLQRAEYKARRNEEEARNAEAEVQRVRTLHRRGSW